MLLGNVVGEVSRSGSLDAASAQQLEGEADLLLVPHGVLHGPLEPQDVHNCKRGCLQQVRQGGFIEQAQRNPIELLTNLKAESC